LCRVNAGVHYRRTYILLACPAQADRAPVADMLAVFAADRLRCHRTLEECPALNACRPTVLAGLSDLGRVDAHMRVGDVVSVKWSSWDGESLVWQQSKTGHLVHV